MTNKEIRMRAKEKQKATRGLVPVILMLYAIMLGLGMLFIVPQMVAQLNAGIEFAIPSSPAFLWGYVAIALVMGMIGGVGMARASLAAWETGHARIADLFFAFTGGRRFARALAPTLLMVAMMLGQMYLYMSILVPRMDALLRSPYPANAFLGLFYVSFIIWLVIAFFVIVVSQLYYAVWIWPETPIFEVLWRGSGRAIRAIWRVIGMGFMVVIKPLLVYYGAMILCSIIGAFMGRVGLAAMMVLLTIGALIYVIARLMPLLLIAFAGLAIDVFTEKGPETEEAE